MRVLEVITSLLTGGAEKLVLEFQKGLAEAGHQVDIAVFNAVDSPFLREAESRSDCRVYKFGHSFYSPLHILRLMRVMRHYDVVHTHNSSPQLFAAIANIVCRKKLITTEHNTHNRKREKWLLRLADKWMYRQYAKIVCISDKAEDLLRGYIGDSGDITTIYNGIDVEGFYNGNVNGNGNWNVNGTLPEARDRFVVVMVAAFRPQKDQKTLVEAMRLLPENDYELWLAREGETMDQMKSFVSEQGMEARVTFLGNRTDVANVLHSADVVVMSTHYEGLSLSNVEGMSVGRPFIATDVDGIHEVTSGAGILVPHEDAEALAREIRRLHDDRDYYDSVAQACYERAKAYDIMNTIDRYDEVINIQR